MFLKCSKSQRQITIRRCTCLLYTSLLYSPELKFYSNKVKMDTDLETNIEGLHCLGDSSGWTRGLMMASVMGVLMGRKLMEKHGF